MGIRRLSSLPKDAAIAQGLPGGSPLADSRRSFARSRSASSRVQSPPHSAAGDATDSAPGTPSVVQHSVAGDLHLATREHRARAPVAATGEPVKESRKQKGNEKREEKAEARKEKKAERAKDFDDEDPRADFFQVRGN